MYEIIMPKLGLDMESGTLLSWYKQEGDRVEQGDALFDVETEKVTMDVEASHAGYLRKIMRNAGEDVEVNTIIAYIGEQDEALPEAASKEAAGEPETTEDVQTVVSIPQERKSPITPLAKRVAREHNVTRSQLAGTGPGGRILREDVENYLKSGTTRIKISPLARKTCREMGIDWTAEVIQGSAPNGRILKADVLAYFDKKHAEAAPLSQPAEEAVLAPQEGAVTIQSTTALTGIRKVIADRISQSKQTIPHMVLHAKADATALIAFREKLKEKVNSLYGVKLTYTDFILKMCASALREHRAINSSLQENTQIIYEDINVGFAVALDDDLLVPTIYQCDRLGLVEIVRKKTELIEKARNGSLQLDDIHNGTFTVTNLGMFRIRSASPIINPPQAAILFVGEIYEEPAVVNGELAIRSSMELSLACDHRIVDGAAGAKFLQHIVELIEEPDMLIL